MSRSFAAAAVVALLLLSRAHRTPFYFAAESASRYCSHSSHIRCCIHGITSLWRLCPAVPSSDYPVCDGYFRRGWSAFNVQRLSHEVRCSNIAKLLPALFSATICVHFIVGSSFDGSHRSLSLKCFVSKFLLKVPCRYSFVGSLSNLRITLLQLQSDAIFQRHLHVSDELRGHLEENALGDTAGGAEPAQSSPPVDSPAAPSRVTSQSLEASQTYMATLRCALSAQTFSNCANSSSGTMPVSLASAGLKISQPAGTTVAAAHAVPVKTLGGQPAPSLMKPLWSRLQPPLLPPLQHLRRCRQVPCFLQLCYRSLSSR